MENKQVVLPDAIETFVNAFKSIGGGELSEQTAINMQKAIKATMIEGKKSTVTVKFDIKQTSEETITIEGESKAAIPTPKVSGAFFVNQQYLPSRNRPDQAVIDFNK